MLYDRVVHCRGRLPVDSFLLQTVPGTVEAESTGPTNGNAQEWHPFIFPFLDNHSKRGTHSKYRFQSLKRYRFHSNGTFKRGLPRGMENGEEHSNAFECCIRMKNIRMLEKSPLGGGGGPGGWAGVGVRVAAAVLPPLCC